MQTDNDEVINILLRLFTNIDLNKVKGMVNENDKNALFDYIDKEFLDINNYKDLLKTIKFDKYIIVEIIYQIISSINMNAQSNKNNDNISLAKRLINNASSHGFTWLNSKECFKKVKEEFKELNEAVKNNDNINIQEEMGDLMFTLVCYADKKGYDINNIINDANTKFEKRFKKLLKIAETENINLDNLSSKEKEYLWLKAKKSTKHNLS